MRSSRTAALGIAGVVSLGLLAACSSAGGATSASSTSAAPQKVTITVAGLLPGAKQDAVDALNTRVKEFEAKYPNITVQPQEYQWLATTFAAQLAGGTLPTVFEIPVTDGKTLIQNGQLADIDAQVKQLPYANDFNQAVVSNAKGDDGKFYAVPAKSFYSVALHYNRTLFTKAGLDPDKPPTTWDEVRKDAKIIHDKTGVAGYGMMALDNAGGWQLVAAANSRGGTVQTTDGKGTYTATLNDPAVKAHLEWLKALRWEDNSVFPDVTLGWAEINQAFAGGQLAMYTSGSDIYTALVQNQGLTKDWGYGLTAIPTENGGGALGGGTLAAVKVQATAAEKDAAVKWIDFWYLSKLLDQDQAVADAKAQSASGQAVGTPVLPIFSKDQYTKSLGWIKDYVNVPLENMKGYTDVMFTQKLVGEPSHATQDTYALLFPVVQAVLTDKNADVDKLLANANTQGQALLDRS
ncbi:extracellular solute-binding protein [Cellulomonas sp. NTE-D12]|uniref:ABC transporter substrate-binding protein n=1 Tax=Cellulomonas sp. NTE-D12 TaxID=2962632 RepID=UPI003081A24F|nr:sugar ABC transporter substrate-binding protein [Cellulomonas sp. NTE-D12]